MTLDIAAIKARADRTPAILKMHRSPWYVSMDGVKDANQCWMFKGSGALDSQIVELANYASTARTDIPALIAALEASEAARVKAEQRGDVLEAAMDLLHGPLSVAALVARAEIAEAARVKAEQERDALKAGNARFRSGLNTLANSYYKDDQHQDYARHVLESSK